MMAIFGDWANVSRNGLKSSYNEIKSLLAHRLRKEIQKRGHVPNSDPEYFVKRFWGYLYVDDNGIAYEEPLVWDKVTIRRFRAAAVCVKWRVKHKRD